MLPQKNPHGHCRTNTHTHTHTKPCWKEASWNLTEGNVLEPRWRKRALKPLLKEKQNCTNKIPSGNCSPRTCTHKPKILPQKTRQERNARKETSSKCKKSHSQEITAQLLARKTCSLPPMQKKETVQNLKLCWSRPLPSWMKNPIFHLDFFFPFIKPPSYIFPFTPKQLGESQHNG
jgi:hypothetical protein